MLANSEETGRSHPALQRATGYLTGCVERGELAGAVTIVARKDEQAQVACIGTRDREAHLPMEPDTIFRIASMTKPITSVGALMLVEAGRLRLDDPVSRYIPEFADAKVFAGVEDGRVMLAPLGRPITVHDLFTHLSGIDSDAPAPALEDDFDNLGDMRYGSDELVRRLAAHPLAHQPGERWSYDWSMAVLGRVIEVITDRPLDAYLESSVLTPLGMVDTGYWVPPVKGHRLAAVYTSEASVLQHLDNEDTRDATRRGPLVIGSSGLASTALDYLRFTRMLLRGGDLDGVRMLKPETVALMTRNHVPSVLCPIVIWGYVSEGEGYGLGVGVSIEPPAPMMPGSAGTYGWAGSWGTRFWVDPVTETLGIFMVQSRPFAFVSPAEGFWSHICEAAAADLRAR